MLLLFQEEPHNSQHWLPHCFHCCFHWSPHYALTLFTIHVISPFHGEAAIMAPLHIFNSSLPLPRIFGHCLSLLLITTILSCCRYYHSFITVHAAITRHTCCFIATPRRHHYHGISCHWLMAFHELSQPSRLFSPPLIHAITDKTLLAALSPLVTHICYTLYFSSSSPPAYIPGFAATLSLPVGCYHTLLIRFVVVIVTCHVILLLHNLLSFNTAYAGAHGYHHHHTPRHLSSKLI